MDKNFNFSFPIQLNTDVKSGQFFLEGYAATGDLDREDEVILKQALMNASVDLLQNTTVFYEHKSTELPIGKIVESKVVEDEGVSKLYVKVFISKTAETIRTLIEEGILNKFSIGGKVIKYKKATLNGKAVTEIQDMELYEVSLVGLPANVKAETIGFEIKKSLDVIMEEPKLKTDTEIMDAQETDLTAEELVKKSELVELKKSADEKLAVEEKARLEKVDADEFEKSVTGKSNLPLAPKDTVWDSTAAIDAIRAWAGGEKRDWAKYEKAFMYCDMSQKENEGAYKLPYADVIGGELKAVPKAIYSIIGAINGARGGVDIPENEKVKILAICKTYQKKIDEESSKQEPVKKDMTDMTSVLDAINELKDLITKLVPVTPTEAVKPMQTSLTTEEVENKIKKAVEESTANLMKTLKVVPTRKGLVVQESVKDEVVDEKNDDENDPLKTLEDSDAFKKLSKSEQSIVIKKGFLSILKKIKPVDNDED